MLILGEIRTCVLQHSRALDRSTVAALLALVEGEPVRRSDRPVPHAVSPTRFTGVDCPLPTQKRCRGIGTIGARAVVTGGRVLQGSTRVRLERAEADRRLPWAHYLARPGVVQAIGKLTTADAVTGFLAASTPGASIDLGAVADRLVGSVQLSARLDHVTPLRAKRIRLRWSAELTAEAAAEGTAPACEFTVVDDTIRTLRLRLPAAAAEDVQGFCENLALHDWALSTLLTLVERSDLDSAGHAAFVRLRPAVDHLLHLWMPGAHVAPALLPLWEGLERQAGFTKQWSVNRDRIRDQLALHTLAAMRNS
ncbi:MAG TPA: SCO2521 family protein [Pseudonocardiaceae bacterium]|nr:SCO2521 family protein [Pseudonocardiaceae bacterium]